MDVMLNVKDALDRMQRAGFSISKSCFCDGMQQDKFPFAIAIKRGGERWSYYISAKKLGDWLLEWCGYMEGISVKSNR